MNEWNMDSSSRILPSLHAVDNNDSANQLIRLVSACTRPFVLINERELSVLRRGLTKDGWKRSLYFQGIDDPYPAHVGMGLLSIANQWLEKDIKIPECGGEYHHFFCDCGIRLVIPDDLEIKDEYICPKCSKKYSGEQADGAVKYLQHIQLSAAALSLALVYAIEKDKLYADKAADILLKYAEAYPGPRTGRVKGGMLQDSKCEAIWAIPLAQAYDLIYYSRSLGDKEREYVERRLLKPIAEGLQGVGIEGTPGSWHLSAVGVLGLATKNAEFVQYALDSFGQQIGQQLGDDGLWPESVHSYHFHVLMAFTHFAEACYRAGIDIYNWEVRPGKSLKSMFAAPLQYAYPSFRLPAINDGRYDSFLPLDLYEIAHRRWDDPTFAWILKKGYKFSEMLINEDQRKFARLFTRSGFYAFLFGRDLPGRSSSPVFRSQGFPDSGICVLRNEDDLMVTFDHGSCLKHGHLDKLSFTLYANDNVLVPDYGTSGYGKNIPQWYVNTAAHNTIMVDGKSQKPAVEDGLIANYCGSYLQYAEAVAADCYPGVTHTRGILLLGSACIIRDTLSSDEEHDYDWLMRCVGEPQVVGEYPASDTDFSSLEPAKINETYLSNDVFRLDWKCESSDLPFVMWNYSGKCNIALGTCLADTAYKNTSFLACRQRAKNARYLSLYAPTESGNSVDISREGCVIKIKENDRVDYIYLREDDTGEPNCEFETDGEIGAIHTMNGEVLSIALLRGSWIKWKGELLVECPQVTDCIEVSFEGRSPVIRYCCDSAGVVRLKTNARAMRINGHRANATNSDGQALLHVTPQMLMADMAGIRS